MIAEQATNVGYIVAAAIATVPASIAAYAALVTARRTKTNHGLTLGQHVEALGTSLAEHTVQDAANFAELRHLIEEKIKP